jgi:hypothetical protein
MWGDAKERMTWLVGFMRNPPPFSPLLGHDAEHVRELMIELGRLLNNHPLVQQFTAGV